ncbi:ATP-dependent DNA helicase [Eisenbergiella tayi]|uniref:Bifunctional ATP-dependent DNA helicase/DNA polymerase III subunit epsilon n=1 Tax=Eisenbergiella tayi TaxID=1432052 RepID=A0A1E2ZZP0_9FIRM|nr:ATP-dependent DNA helicase [Eisenbergiella tayi]ODM01869.1 bifunctional ATP-dependent DNA helicase/DNA polymerase III subunit epsilon [Eisenbergiella tayi]ODR32529.1 helicase [Eisenbergiella tayi]ODR38869.1 helicase [Eisenbergiella tayi]
MEIRISVRSLVEFILRSGSIDNRKGAAPDNAMAEGGRIHRMIQRRMGSDYQAEVVMRYSWSTPAYDLVVEGRADGVINGDVVTIDEIKGTYRDLEKMKEPVDVHLAQAKCYASMYAREHDSAQMKVRMTYCNMETEELRYFVNTYQRAELDEWFEALLTEYKKWADFTNEWQEQRTASIRQLAFPFSYREGQKELATYVYRSIVHKRKLFIEAPTGVGKTLSTVFPAVKAIGEGKAERIFYLTAKTITRTVADNTFQLLRERQLRFKTVILTAKEKICFMEETECNPGACPYADGHYDRINDAIYDLLLHEDHYNREKVEEYARKYKVCPFEMSLDMSLFSDGIICDYNYVFDPHVYLKRFFAEGVQGQYIFLIDEAHNLVDRGREMYSASLVKEDFLALKKIVREYDGKMEHQLDKCSRELLPLKRECEDCRIVGSIEPFVQAVERLYETMEKYLEEHDESPVREDVLDFFFEISHFLLIYDGLDENYVIYTELEEDDSFMVKLFCVNPSVNLKECMQRARSTVLFSATLLPIQYYKSLLGGEKEDFEVYAKSTFNPKKKALYIGSDVTSKYSRRSPKEYYNIAYYLHEITRMRYGNYLIFFPSHSFLQSVFEVYEENFLDSETEECIIQEDIMSEEDREQFLSRFEGNRNCELEDMIHMDIEVEEEKSLLGFCVMGGIFSEGIDLKNDSLIGAVIVGTGLPQVCNEREILKSYFDAAGKNGFDYAYRYPGMNKVLQAAGRVIRTSEDVGIVALLDDRFLNGAYQQLFPREWEEYEVVTADRVARRVERFWDEWL